MNQIITTVEKYLVYKARRRLETYIIEANKASQNSSLEELQVANNTINIAKGMYYILHMFDLVGNARTAEDIERVENKIIGLIEEKKSPGRQSVGSQQTNQSNSKLN